MAALGGDLDELRLELRDSRRRFQRRMQRLFAKYDRPYEDSPLVHMATLTYETPQGLRIWGGKLVDGGQPQDSPEKAEGSTDGQPGAAAASPGGVEAESGGTGATCHQEVLTLMVPQSPLEDELRRKYLAQAELLLQDQDRAQSFDPGEDQDTHGSWDPVRVSLLRPPPGGGCGSSGVHPGALVPLPCTSRGRPASPARLASPASVPNGASFQEADDTLSSCRSLEDVNLCEVTLSDLYVGMLTSMSRLLSTRPACVISTKTSILQNWRLRWRARGRARADRTRCRARGAAVHSPPDAPEPGRRVLRGLQNLQQAPGARASFGLDKGVLAVSPGRGPACRMPQGPALTHAGSSAGSRPDPQKQLPRLQWLVSPAQLAARLQALPTQGGTRSQEVAKRFAELHQTYCPDPWTQPSLTVHPGALVASRALDACRPATAVKGASLPLALPSSACGPLDPAPRSPGSSLPLAPSPRASVLAARSPARFREVTESFGRLHRELCGEPPTSGKGGPPKLSSPCLRYMASAVVRSTRGDPEFPVKRRRLSAPLQCGPRASPRDSPRPVEDVGAQPPDDDERDERKMKEQRAWR